jgi:hypothetical protein
MQNRDRKPKPRARYEPRDEGEHGIFIFDKRKMPYILIGTPGYEPAVQRRKGENPCTN